MSELTEQLEKAREESKDMNEKQYKLQKKRIETQFKQLEKQERIQDAFQNLPIGKNIHERYTKLAVENTEYIKLARGAGVFLGMDTFKDKIALFPRNLILISAETGTGKSTTVANFVESYLKQNKKVIIITNEEYPNDILNRILFLINGWTYSNHDEITDEQAELCEKAYPLLGKCVEVVHDAFNGIGGTTTTVEGIKSICQNLLDSRSEGIRYDAIVLDYIQNVSSSLDAPGMAKWQVMQQCMTYLDNFKGLYDAPLLVFGQLKGNSGDTDHKDRIEGYKAIINHATTAIELKVDRENLRTEWIFRKNRFKGAIGNSVFTGYERGRFVEYDQEFKNKTLAKVEAKKHLNLTKNIFKAKEQK